jgi:hypothetical protein
LAAIIGAASTSVAADDSTPKSSGGSTPTAQTYITVGDVIGEITKVDSTSVTIRITWYTANAPRNTNTGHWGRGTVARTPQQMMQHQIQMQQQVARQAARAASAKPKEHHQDYTFKFTDDAIARIKHLPPKLDENGKKVNYTENELQQAKGNSSLPGYKAELSRLKVGEIVEAHLVHLPKETENLVRWALILNEDHARDTPAKPNKKNNN